MQLYPGGLDCCHHQLASISRQEAECWCCIFWPLKSLWFCSPFGHPTGFISSWCYWILACLVCWLLIWSHSACCHQWSFFTGQQSTVWRPARIHFGPLLFSIYIDQLCSIPLSSLSKLQLYADDISLYKPIDRNNVSNVADLISDINLIAAWVK